MDFFLLWALRMPRLIHGIGDSILDATRFLVNFILFFNWKIIMWFPAYTCYVSWCCVCSSMPVSIDKHNGTIIKQQQCSNETLQHIIIFVCAPFKNHNLTFIETEPLFHLDWMEQSPQESTLNELPTQVENLKLPFWEINAFGRNENYVGAL